MESATRLLGSLLAGAVGDALGAPLEFLSRAEIERRFGTGGPTTLVAGGWPAGSITDDTQMTLFTAEGIIRAHARGESRGICDPPSVLRHAYYRWLHTQGEPVPDQFLGGSEAWPDGWLVKERFLHARRAPGNTCLAALKSGRHGTIDEPLNDSKGCGAVMRMAPAGVFAVLGSDAFRVGCEYGALTHGHPSGYLAAGAFAFMIGHILGGRPLEQALDQAAGLLQDYAGHEEVTAALLCARSAAESGEISAERVESLGAGWVAEEALSIGVYCALVAPDIRTGLRLAVNHSGDSDSTGSIAGNLLGALHGPDAIPPDWLTPLEGRRTIEQLVSDLDTHLLHQQPDIVESDWERYPGW